MKTGDSSSKLLHVVVDTPKGSPIKFKYDVRERRYTIAHVLPPGMVFPFDFGSVPFPGRSPTTAIRSTL